MRSNPKIDTKIGRFFETIPDEELTEKFGQGDLLLDRSGVLAYTLNLPLVLTKIARAMKPGAEIWIMNNRQKIEVIDGRKVDIAEFMGHLPGFEFPNEAAHRRGPAMIRRTSEEFKAPSLILKQVVNDKPPKVLWQVLP